MIPPCCICAKTFSERFRLAKDAGLSSPLIHPLYSSYLNAQEEGLGDQDVMAIISSLKTCSTTTKYQFCEKVMILYSPDISNTYCTLDFIFLV
jgi:hypothetical protein